MGGDGEFNQDKRALIMAVPFMQISNGVNTSDKTINGEMAASVNEIYLAGEQTQRNFPAKFLSLGPEFTN